MTLKEICKGLEGLGYPVAYRAFAEGEVPDPPYIVYYEQGTDNFSADGIPYDIITDLDIELYTKKKDSEAEQKIIDWLTENGMYWEKEEYYIESTELLQVIFETEY